MPASNGELSPEERDKAIKWLEEQKAGSALCPMCGFNQWSLGPNLVMLPVFVPNGILLGGGYPALIVMCNRCGYVRMHHAIAMGLVPPPPPPPPEEKKDKQPEEVKHGV